MIINEKGGIVYRLELKYGDYTKSVITGSLEVIDKYIADHGLVNWFNLSDVKGKWSYVKIELI